MNRLLIAIFAASSLGVAATASADTFEARFEYDRQAGADVNYRQFERIAARACETDLRVAGSLSKKNRIERQCQTQLMDKAVASISEPTLTAFHQGRSGTARSSGAQVAGR